MTVKTFKVNCPFFLHRSVSPKSIPQSRIQLVLLFTNDSDDIFSSFRIDAKDNIFKI